MKYRILTEYLDWYEVMKGDIICYDEQKKLWFLENIRNYALFTDHEFENIVNYHPDWVEKIN